MAFQVIPLDSTLPHYSINVRLDEVNYKIDMDWNERESAWYFSLSTETGTAIVSGLRVVADWPMLRKVRAVEAPPGEIIFQDTSGEGVDPDRYDIGARVQALYAEAA